MSDVELPAKLLNRTIVAVSVHMDSVTSFELDDGTHVYVGGGEDAHGGYGYLTLDPESLG